MRPQNLLGATVTIVQIVCTLLLLYTSGGPTPTQASLLLRSAKYARNIKLPTLSTTTTTTTSNTTQEKVNHHVPQDGFKKVEEASNTNEHAADSLKLEEAAKKMSEASGPLMEKRLFVVELLKMLHEQYGDRRADHPTKGAAAGGSAADSMKRGPDRQSTSSSLNGQAMSQLLEAIGADGDARRLIDWIQSSFNHATLGDMLSQFVVGRLGSVNCAALLSPDAEEKLVPRFLLFNEHFVDVPFELPINPKRNECLEQAHFDPQRKTVLLVHGFLAGYTLVDGFTNIKNRLLDLNRQVRKRALKAFSEAAQNNGSYVLTDNLEAVVRQNQYNVIVVDWFNGANPYPRSNYIRAAVNAQVVGQLIARFLVNMVAQCHVPASRMHIIAHSLGCHVAGFTGKAMNGAGHRLGKITHLDPVGLCFGRLFTKPQHRLHPSDALETQAVHVSLNLFDNPLDGVQSNFLVNGGRDQIGCQPSELTNSTTSSVSLVYDSNAKFAPCSHMRALSLFEDDLSSEPGKCQIVGYRCTTYERFLAGKCGKCDNQNGQCRLMSLPPMFATFRRLTFNTPRPPMVGGNYGTSYNGYYRQPQQQQQLYGNNYQQQLQQQATSGGSYNTSVHYDDDAAAAASAANAASGEPPLVNLVSHISNGSIAWVIDDRELNQKIGAAIAKMKPEILVGKRLPAAPPMSQLQQQYEEQQQRLRQQYEEQQQVETTNATATSADETSQATTVDNLEGGVLQSNNEIGLPSRARAERRTGGSSIIGGGVGGGGMITVQRIRLAQTIDKIRTDTKNALAEGWTSLKNGDVRLKLSTMVSQHLPPINHLLTIPIPNSEPAAPLLAAEAAALVAAVGLHETQPSPVPLGGQPLPRGSINGPLYFVGTGPVSSYCLNYYQVRVLIAESRLSRLRSGSSGGEKRSSPPVIVANGRARMGSGGIGQSAVASVASEMIKEVVAEHSSSSNGGAGQHPLTGRNSRRDMLHLTMKLTDSTGQFFKGFSLLEDMHQLSLVPIETKDHRAVAGSKNMIELTMLLNTTKPEPVRISEAVISYYFHPIVLADMVEVNYMSNISPE